MCNGSMPCTGLPSCLRFCHIVFYVVLCPSMQSCVYLLCCFLRLSQCVLVFPFIGVSFCVAGYHRSVFSEGCCVSFIIMLWSPPRRLASGILRLCCMESQAVAAGLLFCLSPQVASSLMWSLTEWSSAYLMPNEDDCVQVSCASTPATTVMLVQRCV